MGHAKVDTTLNVYAQVLDDSVRDAAQWVGNGLFTVPRRCRRQLIETIGSCWIRAESNEPKAS